VILFEYSALQGKRRSDVNKAFPGLSACMLSVHMFFIAKCTTCYLAVVKSPKIPCCLLLTTGICVSASILSPSCKSAYFCKPSLKARLHFTNFICEQRQNLRVTDVIKICILRFSNSLNANRMSSFICFSQASSVSFAYRPLRAMCLSVCLW
jgi:hypothetical protein